MVTSGYSVIHPNVVGSVVTFRHSSSDEWYETLSSALEETRHTLAPLVPPGLKVGWQYVRHFRSKTLRWSPQKDQEFYGLLRRGQMENFCLLTNLAGEFGPWVIAGEVSPIRPGWPTVFQFSFDPRCASRDGQGMSAWQDSLVNLLCSLVTKLQGASALLTLEPNSIGPGLAPTPYEQWVSAPLDFPTTLTGMLRGYYWGNVLGPTHIKALGGMDRLRNEAPCFTRPFPSPDGPWLYLQTSADITDYSDQSLRVVRDFLRPLLYTGPRVHGLDRRFRLINDKWH